MISHDGSKERVKPLFALTMGDPAGIGPEIAAKACAHAHFRDSVMVIGDADVFEQEIHRYIGRVQVIRITSPFEYKTGQIHVLDLHAAPVGSFEIGKVQAICGMAAYQYIETAIDLAMSGSIDGVITNPINKESLSCAGIKYPGHTEIFAEKTRTTSYSMLFLLNNKGVAHVTTHCSLRKALDLITVDRVEASIALLDRALRDLGIASPRIAVGGVNPHAGEHGLFGDEEQRYITPAIERAKKEGIAVSGPYPPDTVFMRTFRGEFDGVVAMLHDHGFVALKSMDFDHGVNITIGLPIIRTSVGHGTAFDIAGKGIAHPDSLLAAHDAAVRLFTNRIHA